MPVLNILIIDPLTRLNKAISARSQSFFLYSEPIYRMSKYYRDEMESREVCYSSADMVSRDWMFTCAYVALNGCGIEIWKLFSFARMIVQQT